MRSTSLCRGFRSSQRDRQISSWSTRGLPGEFGQAVHWDCRVDKMTAQPTHGSTTTREVNAGLKQFISTNSSNAHGAACFAEMHIPVTVVLDKLADGAAPAEILRRYLALRAEHIVAALSYAAILARDRATPVAHTG